MVFLLPRRRRFALAPDVRHALDTDGVVVESLARARDLGARAIGVGQYHVVGGTEDHYVDLVSGDIPRCDCADYLYRDRLCKHVLAALISAGDRRVASALRHLRARERREAAACADGVPCACGGRERYCPECRGSGLRTA